MLGGHKVSPLSVETDSSAQRSQLWLMPLERRCTKFPWHPEHQVGHHPKSKKAHQPWTSQVATIERQPSM